ncbi:MAG: hypothetical protein PHU78_04240 [Heliobacteriaceae bacterium]|nr:hypothetical protein [Heliobacteriaceae bacterium]
MRQWRVGTLTMGLVLVFSGIGLLYAQFQPAGVVTSLFKWWPVIFVFLGLEVLIQNYLKKDESSVLRYDIFSIIIIFLLVVTGLGLHITSELGLSKIIHNEINQQVFSVPVSREIPLDSELSSKLVLESGTEDIRISTHSGSSILVRATLKVRAESSEEAAAKAEQFTLVTEQKAGDTLYLGSGSAQNSGWLENVSLSVPEYLVTQLVLDGNTAEIDLNSLKSNWQINGPGNCSLNLPSTADVTVTALVDRKKDLHGNLAWNQLPSPSADGRKDDNRDEESAVQAQAKLGNGTHKLNVIDVQSLTVNQIP